ncbi:MAG: hypothetical protein OEV42_09685 [Deltaproteobacteria bacterium]|nr:hypothetical protein [Deltaproteobacteria bacterium]
MIRLLFGLMLLLFPFTVFAAGVEENILAKDVNAIPKMTVETLKAKMDKKEKIAVIDSRTGGSWDHSNQKIKGAIRLAYQNVAKEAASKIPMGSEIVVYCT